MNTTFTFVAVGSNLPPEDQTALEIVQSALERLQKKRLSLKRVSRFYMTPCFPAGAGPDYVNACVMCESAFSPQETLQKLHEIEAEFGRERVQRWGSRVLDLDLLAFGQQIRPDLETYDTWRSLPLKDQMSQSPDQLILPHPRIQDRAFVLVPLNDIAFDWSHPILSQTVDQMLAEIPPHETAKVVPI